MCRTFDFRANTSSKEQDHGRDGLAVECCLLGIDLQQDPFSTTQQAEHLTQCHKRLNPGCRSVPCRCVLDTYRQNKVRHSLVPVLKYTCTRIVQDRLCLLEIFLFRQSIIVCPLVARTPPGALDSRQIQPHAFDRVHHDHNFYDYETGEPKRLQYIY